MELIDGSYHIDNIFDIWNTFPCQIESYIFVFTVYKKLMIDLR